MNGLSRHLYLRIWLAVVLGVALLMTLVGWAWHVSVEHNAANPPMREWVVRNAQGEVLASTTARPQPGTPLQLEVPVQGHPPLQLFLERRLERPGGGMVHLGGRPPHPRDLAPWWARPPFGFVWMLALMGVATALALYPVVRRLTKRLEGLQQGVQRWGDGDLSVRMPESGDDEVADLSRRFNAAAQRIQSLMGAQKSLLANASHELRSPLARIRMGLELMDAPGANEAVRERTRSEILRNMAELDQLIDEILLASRLDARDADMGTVEPVDLVGLCAEECARVGARLDVPEGLASLEVQGVAKLLRRMVRNLLENAVRYGAASGDEDVVLGLAHQEGALVLRVCDRGPGVPPAYRERIFEPFFRLPGASERAGGVGLGLALVKSIAERHGAQVHCTDRDGVGACFELRGFHRSPA
ncbi:MAG: Sensor protein RstB [Pseudomonadota bacterium]|jgi:signal transduction histidine kinase